jgi:colanic acid/amylovoran biosynthesis glycosyltransferase
VRIAAFRHRVAPGMEPFIERQLRGLGPDIRLFTITTSSIPDVETWSLADHASVPGVAVRAFQLTRRSRRLRRAIADFAPDVVLAHFAQDAWRIERTTRALGIPLAAVIHGSDALVSDSAAGSALGLSARQLRWHWPDLAASASLFLPVSDHVGQRLRVRGVLQDKIVRHYLGVETVPQPACLQPRYDVGFMGRLEPNKGALRLVRTIAANLDHFDSLGHPPRVLVVGDGSEREEIERVAREGHGVKVDVVGWVNPSEIPGRIASCAVVVCPSVELPSGMAEGLGLVSLEAQAVGRPVVAFATGGLSETVRDGETGLLVPSGQWTKLADVVASLLADGARRDAMGAAGHRWIKEAWDIRRQNAELLALLETRFGGQRRGAARA